MHQRETGDGTATGNTTRLDWSAESPAQEVHGPTKERSASLGWEWSFLGYPLNDELATPAAVGRHTHFQGGSVYCTPVEGGAFVGEGFGSRVHVPLPGV